MNLTECLPHPQSQKSFDKWEALDEIKSRLGNDAFPYFLQDLKSKSSWEVVKLWGIKELTAVRVTMLRQLLCRESLELIPELQKYEMPKPSHLRLAYSTVDSTDEIQSAA